MPRFNSPTAARPMPWDRNPVTLATFSALRVSEDLASTVRFTYTVPSGTKAFLDFLSMVILCEVAATTTTVTDQMINSFEIQPSGGVFTLALVNRMHPASMVANDRESISLAPATPLVAGDAIRAAASFSGDAAGAGRVIMDTFLTRTEFSA